MLQRPPTPPITFHQSLITFPDPLGTFSAS
jgi:hypothetical protein